MKCGGCVGHVKKLLEEHPAVLHATVNLATETALVRVSLAAGADLDKLAADLAKVRHAIAC
jgi:Cu2+-exporting ATPase